VDRPELHPGGCDDLDVDAGPGGQAHHLVAHLGRLVDVGAVDGEDAVRPGRPDRGRAVVGVDDAHPHRCPGRDLDRDVAGAAVHRRRAVVDVEQGERLLADRLRRVDDERAEQALPHLLVRDLVGVVPERAGLVGDEAGDVLAADGHGVLGDARDAVDRVGHVDAVPVQRDALLDGGVLEPDLDELALAGADDRARRGAVEGEAVDLLARRQREALLACDRSTRTSAGRSGSR
jgi:hypothetical protein